MADPKHPTPWRVDSMHPLWIQDARLNHVLTAPDPDTAALIVECVTGKGVLDAMAAVEDIAIDMTLDLRDDLSVREVRVWEAEQARRAAKERKDG